MLKSAFFKLGLLKHKYYRDNFFEKIRKGSSKDIYSQENVLNFAKKTKEPISFYYFSGGTTGKPKTIPLTKSELTAKSVYRGECYKEIGVNKNSRVAILLPFGPWVAGPSAYLAAKSIGCTVFPIGLLKDEKEILSLFSIIQKHQIDNIITVPSFVDYMISVAVKEKVKIKIDNIITSGEFISNFTRKNAENVFGSKIYSTYASSEGFVGYECSEDLGYHYNKKNVLAEEKDGHIRLTFIDSKVVPIFRYNIGDKGEIINQKCKCGSNNPRIKLQGRDSNVFSLTGAVNVFPNQIIEFIKHNQIPAKECHVILNDLDHGRDEVTFRFGFDKKQESSKYAKTIKDNIKNLSLDFADIYNQNLIEVEVITFQSEHSGNKIKINVEDNRSHEK